MKKFDMSAINDTQKILSKLSGWDRINKGQITREEHDEAVRCFCLLQLLKQDIFLLQESFEYMDKGYMELSHTLGDRE